MLTIRVTSELVRERDGKKEKDEILLGHWATVGMAAIFGQRICSCLDKAHRELWLCN